MDFTKNSFQKIKEDLNEIYREIYFLKKELNKNNEQLLEFAEILENLLKNKKLDRQTDRQT